MHQPVYKDKAITLLTSEGTTLEQLKNKAKALLTQLKREGEQNGWAGKITLVGSEHKSNMSIKYKEQGEKGRPKTLFYELKRYNCKAEPHLHLLLEQANPNTVITSYMNEYWTKREGKGTTHFKNAYNSTGYLAYMDMQASFTRSMEM